MNEEIQELQELLSINATDLFVVKRPGSIKANKATAETLLELIFKSINLNVISAVFKGKADPSDTPEPPTSPVFYIGVTGVYPNFGGVEITGDFGFIIWNGTEWQSANVDLNLSELVEALNFIVLQSNRDFTDLVTIGEVYNFASGAGPTVSGFYDNGVFRVTPNVEYKSTQPIHKVIFYSGIPGAGTYISTGAGTNTTSFTTPADCYFMVCVMETRSTKDAYEGLAVLPLNDLYFSIESNLSEVITYGRQFKLNTQISGYVKLLTAYNIATGAPNLVSAFYDSAEIKTQPLKSYKSDVNPEFIVFYNGEPSIDTFISSLSPVVNGSFTTPANCQFAALVFQRRSLGFYNAKFIQAVGDISPVTKNRVDLLNIFKQKINSISTENKSLVKIVFAGDSLTANQIGGAIPADLDEGNSMQPMRLLSNNFPRRMYDALSWNKPIWRRLDNTDWTNSTFVNFTEAGMFEGTSEVYYRSGTSGGYIEITVPTGSENFALICRQKAGSGKLNVTLNGGAIGSYANPYYDAKVLTNVNVTTAQVPAFLPRGLSQIDLNKTGSSTVGNPYHIVEFKNLPPNQDNVLRFTMNSNTSCDVWGGFYWSGSTMVAMNIGHGGHTTTDLLTEHLQDELFDEIYDHIIFEIPEMNNVRLSLVQSETDIRSIITTLKGRDVVYTSCNMYGLSITYDVNMWPYYTPGGGGATATSIDLLNEKVNEIMADEKEAFIDIYDHFVKLIAARGGSLTGGEVGLWYTHDGQHGNEAGCREWFNVLYKNWMNLHFKFNTRS